jgi:hypothetical protein
MARELGYRFSEPYLSGRNKYKTYSECTAGTIGTHSAGAGNTDDAVVHLMPPHSFSHGEKLGPR